jgi:hypothetical protein
MRLFAILLLLCPAAFAQESLGPDIELAQLLGGHGQIQQIHQELIDTMIVANPKFAPYQPVIESWAQQYITWGAIEEQIAAMYRQYFTDEELTDLVDFYRSETGRKTVLLMPTLLRESNLIGKQLAEEHRVALIDMLNDVQSSEQAPALPDTTSSPVHAE